jgi:hypothetical protein
MERSRKTDVTPRPQFLIAKYAPDLRRMEPRNIGVIVWSQNGVAARFLGETSGGDLVVPRQAGVRSANAYRQWIEFWRGKLTRGFIRKKSGAKVGIDQPEFLEELRKKSKRQYMLVDGGYFAKQLASTDIGDAADELFSELVAQDAVAAELKAEHTEAARTLRRNSKKAMKESGLSKRRDFWSDFNWLCPVGDTKQHFVFDYALHRQKPSLVATQLALWKLNDVHGAAFRFQAMQSAYNMPASKCASLVLATSRDMQQEDVQQALKMMESISTVVNVANLEQAAAQLADLAA